MNIKGTLIPALSIITIGLLMAFALHKGLDGLMLVGAVGLIAGIGGFKLPKKPPNPPS